MRTHLPVVVLDPTTGNAIAGAQITILNRSNGTTATVYASEVGGSTKVQPLVTDSAGRVDGWVERGSYTLNFIVPGTAAYTEYYDSSPATDGAIDTAWLAAQSVTAAKIANATITQTQMAANSIGTSQLQAGSVTNSILAANAVTTTNLQTSAVTLATLDSGVLPAGVIWAYGGSAAPTGWVLCQGQALNRTTFSALFAIIGTAYGVGDGATTFNVPDLRGRSPFGLGTHTDVSTLGKTENPAITLASRKPRHRHGLGTAATNATGSHSHGGVTNAENVNHTHGTGGFSNFLTDDINASLYGIVQNTLGGSNLGLFRQTATGIPRNLHAHAISSDGNHSHSLSGAIGDTSDGSGPLDSATFQVVNYIIKT